MNCGCEAVFSRVVFAVGFIAEPVGFVRDKFFCDDECFPDFFHERGSPSLRILLITFCMNGLRVSFSLLITIVSRIVLEIAVMMSAISV